MMIRLATALVGFFALGALLAGCATLSKAECHTGDWRGLGLRDGDRGRPATYIGEHISACSEHGISINRQLYEAGRQEGLLSYCRLDRAEIEGRAGRINHRVCTGDIGFSFDKVHAAARDIHQLEQKITVADGEMEHLLDRIAAPSLSDADRQNLRSDISDLQWEIDRLKRELKLDERELRLILSEEQQRLR